MKVNPADIVCSDRYLICDSEQPAFQRLCQHAWTALDTQSVLVLPDFVRPEALASGMAQSERVTSSLS